MRESIFTEKGAKPVGPYSQAIVADGPMVYVSGQGPLDPETGNYASAVFTNRQNWFFKT